MDSTFSDNFQQRFPNIKSIKEILSLEFPPQEWLVEDLLPLGITILAGPPKIGKSYFVLDLITEIQKKIMRFSIMLVKMTLGEFKLELFNLE